MPAPCFPRLRGLDAVRLFALMIEVGANNIPRGARCVREQPLVPAASCVSKSRVNHSESASVTASPVSVGRAVSLQRWPASPHPIRSSAPQLSTFALVTKEPGSSSASALSAGQPCSTPKKVTNNRLWVSPWAPSPIQTFRHLEARSTTVADILGFNYRRGQGRTTRTRPDCKPCPKGTKPRAIAWSKTSMPFSGFTGTIVGIGQQRSERRDQCARTRIVSPTVFRIWRSSS
jgi:hypothetical protein